MKKEYQDRLDDCTDELEKIKIRINRDPFDEMVLFLQRYAIIKSCGTIEYVIKNLISDYVETDSTEEIKTYITKKVRDSSTNPTTGNISNLLGEFSSDNWKKFFDTCISSMSEEKMRLNSLVQLRNDFAHGSSPNTTISTIIKHFESSKRVVDVVDRAVNNECT